MFKKLCLSVAIAAFVATPVMAEDMAAKREEMHKKIAEKMQEIFAEADANKDGKLSVEEAATNRENHFKKMDTDSSSSLSKDEFLSLPDIPADKLSKPDVQKRLDHMRELRNKRFDKMDANKDGALDLAEFTSRQEEWFERKDKNNDGAISLEEWKMKKRRGMEDKDADDKKMDDAAADEKAPEAEEKSE